MSPRCPVRPAARSVAVRPHSAFLSSPGKDFRPPRPAWSAPIVFFVSTPRPDDDQSSWSATAGWRVGLGGVGTGTALGTSLVTRKRCVVRRLRHSSHCSQSGRAHVIRSRVRAPTLSLSLLETWEHIDNSYVIQSLGCFWRRSRRALPLGTWEHKGCSALAPDRRFGAANKIGAGYGHLQPSGGGARRKFRASSASIAAVQGVGLVLGRADPRQLTRRSDNGAFPGLPKVGGGHVGRVMLERSGQAAVIAPLSGRRRKLRRLGALRPGRAIDQLAGADRGELGRGGGGPPFAAVRGACMLALDVGRIWIERASRADLSRPGKDFEGLCPDRRQGSRKNRQGLGHQRGPGGSFPLDPTSAIGEKPRNSGDAGRAGVVAGRGPRPHDAGGMAKLRRAVAAVNGFAA